MNDDDVTLAERFNEATVAARILKNLHSKGHLNPDIADVYELLSEQQRRDIVMGFIEGLAIQEIADEEAKNLHPSVMAELESIRKADRLSLMRLKEFFTKTVLVYLSVTSILTLVGFFFMESFINKVPEGYDEILRIISKMIGA